MVSCRVPVLLGLLPALLLGGCLAPEPPDPKLDVPSAFRNAAAAPVPSMRADWWKGYGSAELTRFAEAAETGNLDIAAAAARIRQADARAQIAGAPLLPLIGATADARRSRAGSADGTRVGEGINRYGVGLNASYEIDLWGRNRDIATAAQTDALASRYDRDVIALTSTASAVQLYVRIMAGRDRLRIARKNLESAQRVETLIRERVEAGTATALDLAQQESVVAGLRADIPPIEQAIEENTASLAVLIGRAPERIGVRGTGMGTLGLPLPRPGLPSELLLRRPDIAAAEARLAAANGDVQAARKAFFPTISLTAAGGFESIALRNLFNPGAGFYSIGAGLTQPIFQGFRLEGELELARGREAELLQEYRKSVISAFADVERSLVAVRQLAEQERLQRQSLESSRRAYELAGQRLREGTVDIVTVLNVQQSLFQAEDALTLVRLARLLASISLYQALGGGFVRTPGITAAEHAPPS
ncbi:efflux transporter outer membrane subunit [Alsobacter sp. R-9]